MGTVTGVDVFQIDSQFDISIRGSTHYLNLYFDCVSSDFQMRITPPDVAELRDLYSVVIVDSVGTVITQLANVTVEPLTYNLDDNDFASFSLPLYDPQNASVRLLEIEIQIWRGNQMIFWGVPVRGNQSDSGVAYQCVSLEWLLARRLIGLVPSAGHFTNPLFTEGTFGWTFGRDAKSKPLSYPVFSVVDSPSLSGKAVSISPSTGITTTVSSADPMFTSTTSSALTPAGQTTIQGIVNSSYGTSPELSVVVYHDSRTSSNAQALTDSRALAIESYILTLKPTATVKAYGVGSKQPRSTNTTSAGRASNRRVSFAYKNDAGKTGHLQYIGQTKLLTNSSTYKRPVTVKARAWVYIEHYIGSAGNAWGLVLERRSNVKKVTKVKERQVFPLNKDTAHGRWILFEAELMAPPDGKEYEYVAKVYPPNGLMYVGEFNLYTDDALSFIDEDQTTIAEKIVQHVQDPALGKADLNITTNCRPSGVTRTIDYFYADRDTAIDAIGALSQYVRGFEWSIVTTPTQRIFTTYYPYRGKITNYVLQEGANAQTVEFRLDADSTATQIVTRGSDNVGSLAPEGFSKGVSQGDGLILEAVFDVTGSSDVPSLNEQARLLLTKTKYASQTLTVVAKPSETSNILTNLGIGDIATVRWEQAVSGVDGGMFRVTSMSLDPATDTVTLTMTRAPDTVIAAISFGDKWKWQSTAQSAITGADNTAPVLPSSIAPSEAGYNDDAWAVGTAPMGWYIDGSVTSQGTYNTINTTITNQHQVWIRRSFKATSQAYLSIKVDTFAYVWVNGHAITDHNGSSYFQGNDFTPVNPRPAVRIPDSYLNTSGEQEIAILVQDRLADVSTSSRCLIADAQIIAVYDQETL